MKGWVNLNLNEIKFACNSKYSKINFRCMSFYEQIQFILQMLKYYGFSSFSVEDVNTMYQLINIKSIENEYIEDSNIYMGGKLNYSERND